MPLEEGLEENPAASRMNLTPWKHGMLYYPYFCTLGKGEAEH